jgi:hypothetical protein
MDDESDSGAPAQELDEKIESVDSTEELVRKVRGH